MLDNLSLPSIPDSVKEKTYDDTMHPVAKEAGKSLETVGMVVNKILSPLRKWATNGEDNTSKLEAAVQERLSDVAEENIVEPQSEIAVPVIIANSYTSSDALRSLYANLLAKAMDRRENTAHPSYVEIIKQLSPDEALLLKSTSLLIKPTAICSIRWQKKTVFSDGIGFNLHSENIIRDFVGGVDLLPYYTPRLTTFAPEKSALMIDNLLRLRLLNVPEGKILSDPNAYAHFFEDDFTKSLVIDDASPDQELAHIPMAIAPTQFGKDFYRTCIETSVNVYVNL